MRISDRIRIAEEELTPRGLIEAKYLIMNPYTYGELNDDITAEESRDLDEDDIYAGLIVCVSNYFHLKDFDIV